MVGVKMKDKSIIESIVKSMIEGVAQDHEALKKLYLMVSKTLVEHLPEKAVVELLM